MRIPIVAIRLANLVHEFATQKREIPVCATTPDLTSDVAIAHPQCQPFRITKGADGNAVPRFRRIELEATVDRSRFGRR